MVSNLPIRGGDEVFNTYERGLTNAQLLSQYGFALDANENNVVRVDGVVRDEATIRLWARLVGEWAGSPGWDDLALVYGDADGVPKINADGEISHGFWLLALSVAVQGLGASDTSCVAARMQEQLLPGATFCPGPSAGLLRSTAISVVQICDRKMGSAHCHAIAERLDVCVPPRRAGTALNGFRSQTTPPERALTRQAMAYALEEWKLVESCGRAWRELT